MITEEQFHSGEKSALLRLRGDETSGDTKIVGVVQDIVPEEMPRRIAGHYQVRNWVKGAEYQYIQCVVMVWDVPGYAEAPLQIRYIIAGIGTEPFELDNAEYIFVSPHEPTENRWMDFDRDLHEDFRNTWGFIPDQYSMIRVVFEVRYDGVPDSECQADVYWDDVYLGA